MIFLIIFSKFSLYLIDIKVLFLEPQSTGIEGPDIITEVTNLIARLECERQLNEERLKQQRGIVRWLLGQIDILAERRLEKLPIAVQEG